MPDISTFTGGIAQTNGHLFTLLVDAPEGIAAWLKQRGVSVAALLLTHQHFDHVQDAAAVREQHGCKVYAWSPLSKDLTLELLYGAVTGSAFSVPEFTVDEVLAGQTEITVCGARFELFHVPGHSPDSLCFYLPEKKKLFGGDVLFLDGVGRTDFPGGSFEQLQSGIESKLWPLPDDTRVFPGHGPATSIGRERVQNPFVGQG
jgi:hydroxyacylglutathione hydrolase